jgi:hypothetical protein
MSAPTYTQRVVDAMCMTTKGKLVPLKVGEVVRDDGVVVWKTRGYTSPRAATLQAGVTRRRFEDYARDYGTCWRADRNAAAVALREKRRARALAIHALDDAVRAGFKAYEDGAVFETNPFSTEDSFGEWWAWGAGWLKARGHAGEVH